MQDAGFPLTLTRTVFRQWASAFFSTCLQEQKAQEHAGSEGDNNMGYTKRKTKTKTKPMYVARVHPTYPMTCLCNTTQPAVALLGTRSLSAVLCPPLALFK